MITCEKCAHQNADGESFCANCGSFLKFTSSKSSGSEAPVNEGAEVANVPPPPPPPPPEEVVESRPPPPPLPEPEPEQYRPPVEPAPVAASPTPTPADAGALVASTPVDPTPLEPQTVYSTQDRPTAVISTQGGEQRPARTDIEKRRRVKTRQDKEEDKQRQAEYRRKGLRPGELVCPTCGAGNDPTRQFCRIDATALHQAEVVVQTAWWRQLNPFSARSKQDRHRKHREQGQSVSHGGGRKKARIAYRKGVSLFGKMGRLMAIFTIVGIGVVAFVPSLRANVTDRSEGAVDRVRDWFGYAPNDPINSVSVNVSSASDLVPFAQCRPEGASSRPEDALRDGKAFTYWAEGVGGTGINTVIEFEFQARIDLNSIGIFSGPGACADADFLANPRPRSIELRFLRDDGVLEQVGSERLELIDTADFQSFEVDGDDLDRVQLVILSVYESDQGTATAIAEVEFFGKLG